MGICTHRGCRVLGTNPIFSDGKRLFAILCDSHLESVSESSGVRLTIIHDSYLSRSQAKKISRYII